jgi:SAM-dependent methyltransferase
MFERKIEIHQEEAFEGMEAARRYAEEERKSMVRYQAFLDRLRSFGIEGRYLDVGAGSGVVAGLIAESNPGVEIVALELSKDMVSVGRDYLKSKGLQRQVEFVIGDAADHALIRTIGEFDVVYSTYSLHHWQNPRRVIDNLMTSLVNDGILLIHDLRRVWWLYWLPIQTGFFKSIRGAYVEQEVRGFLDGLPESYVIKNEFPFMHSLIIKKSSSSRGESSEASSSRNRINVTHDRHAE